MWLKILFDELGITITPIPVFEDNQNVINWTRDRAIRAKTKHIGIQLQFVREAEENEIIALVWVPGNEQIADALTKPLAYPAFNKLTSKMGCKNQD